VKYTTLIQHSHLNYTLYLKSDRNVMIELREAGSIGYLLVSLDCSYLLKYQ
jgi:hypothetical protein